MSKYRVFSGSYFPLFGLKTEIFETQENLSPNTGKYEAEKTPFNFLLNIGLESYFESDNRS